MSRYRSITMDIVRTRAEARAALNRAAGRVGLAATMGALHDGHVAVIRADAGRKRRSGRQPVR